MITQMKTSNPKIKYMAIQAGHDVLIPSRFAQELDELFAKNEMFFIRCGRLGSTILIVEPALGSVSSSDDVLNLETSDRDLLFRVIQSAVEYWASPRRAQEA